MTLTKKNIAGIAVMMIAVIAVFAYTVNVRASQDETEAIVHRLLTAQEAVLSRLLDMVAAGGVALPEMDELQGFGGTTNLDALSLDSSLTVTGAVTNSSTLAVTGATTLSSTLTVAGAAQHDGLYTYSPNATATTTAGASNTLVENDLLNVGYHIVTPGGLASGADMTYTFPASTTMTTFLDGIGERAEVCWFRTATTTGSDLIFAAGTGIDIKAASTTAASEVVPSLQVGSEDEACFEFQRQPDGSGSQLGNVTALLKIYQDID